MIRSEQSGGLAVSVVALSAALVAALTATRRADAVEILIPSYFHPGQSINYWPQLNAAAAQVGITAILNPNSGPTANVDTSYRSAVNSLRAAGGRVIAYVSTSYTTQPIAQVKADILKYTQQYTIDGFFLDEMTNTNDTAALKYYADVYAYIKTLNADYRVVGNPGTNTQPAYLTRPTTDTLVTFESDTGYAAFTPSAWTTSYAPRRFSNLPYELPDSASMTTAVNAAASKRVGYVYVSDDGVDGNPWDRLPTYWAAELNTVRSLTPTWTNAESANWNVASNWTTTAAPNGVGAEAYLLGAISAPRTLYTNSDITLGTLVFNNAQRYVITGAGSLTMDASVESALIDVRSGRHTINLPLILADPTTAFIATGATLEIADPLTILSTGSLTKAGGGTLTILSTVNDAKLNLTAGALTLAVGGSVQSLSMTTGATLDVGSGIVLADTAKNLTGVREAIGRAYADGTWQGEGLVATGVDAQHGVAYLGDGRVAAALNGDADLNGRVDLRDLIAIAATPSEAGSWASGDFNYDGRRDAIDLALVRANYFSGDAAFAPDWSFAQMLAPEPASMLTTVAVTAASMRRRPR